MARLGERAVVIGASMGGLLAARALTEFYDAVTVIERDELPAGCGPRKGVPQARHGHGLLAKGREVLEQFFPGFTKEMVAQGASAGDLLDRCLWFNHGVYLKSAPSGMIGLALSRPMLEDGVRRRLAQLRNVRIRERCDVLEVAYDGGRRRVAVRVRGAGCAKEGETIAADLVVDASGRGSRSPDWLRAMGYASPAEEEIAVDVWYTTRQYRRRPEQLGGRIAVVMAACHPDWRGGALIAQEGDRWILSLGGYLGDRAPQDDAGFLNYVRSLQRPEIFDVIRDAEPLNEPTLYHFKANLRHRYERSPAFPEGFLVFRDALCSFNPVYGQGMTVACLEAAALRACLARGSQAIGLRFFRAAAQVVDTPWQIAVGSDLQHPKVAGKRTAPTRFVNWYVGKLYRAAEHDEVLAKSFLEVANLMNKPEALLRPQIMRRVWAGGRRRGYRQPEPAVA